MITYDMLRTLHTIGDGRNPIVSLYLKIDPAGDFVKRCRNLLYDALKAARRENRISEVQMQRIEGDLRKIQNFVEQNAPIWIKEAQVAQVVIFSSQPLRFWQVYPLPRAARERAVVDLSPYIRPLTLLLDEYKRYYVVLVDPKKARLFEMFLGSIQEEEKFVDVVGRVKTPPPRLRRKVDYAIYNHYQRVAEVLYDRYRMGRFDLLIVGGPPEALAGFLPFLPYSLRHVLAGTFTAPVNISVREALKEARKIERAYEMREEREIVETLKNELAKKDHGAVAGLREVLRALMENRVTTVVVAEGFEHPGVRCPKCGYLGLEEETCPSCGAPTVKVPDVVDDLIEEAVEQGARIEHVLEPSLLADIGHIGALLRYPEE